MFIYIKIAKKILCFLFCYILLYIIFVCKYVFFIMAKNRTIRLPEPDFLPKKTLRRTDGRYQPVYDRQVYFLALLGMTEPQMAQVFNVQFNNFLIWKEKYPLFAEALIKGKTSADGNVVHSLYLSAIGFKHKETVVLTNKVKKYNSEGKVIKEWTEPLLVEVEKEEPPSVNACLKWLQARQPAVWGNRLHIDGKLNVTHQIDLTDFTTEELLVLNKLGMASKDGKIVEDALYEDV